MIKELTNPTYFPDQWLYHKDEELYSTYLKCCIWQTDGKLVELHDSYKECPSQVYLENGKLSKMWMYPGEKFHKENPPPAPLIPRFNSYKVIGKVKSERFSEYYSIVASNKPWETRANCWFDYRGTQSKKVGKVNVEKYLKDPEKFNKELVYLGDRYIASLRNLPNKEDIYFGFHQ